MSKRGKADALFMLIGLAPILLAFYLEDHGVTAVWRDLAKDFGVVIISLALVDLLWDLVAGGDPLSQEIHSLIDLSVVTRQANENGVVDLSWKRANLTDQSTSITRAIQHSKKNVDMSGYTLYVLVETQGFLRELVDRAKDGVKVRLLLCASDNSALSGGVDRGLLETMQAQSLRTSAQLLKARMGLSPEKRSNFEVRVLTDKILYTSILRFDERINAVHYLHSRYTPECPVLVVRGADTPLFRTYLAEFDWCFERAKSLSEA